MQGLPGVSSGSGFRLSARQNTGGQSPDRNGDEGFQGEGEPSENPDTIAKVNVREGREVNYTKIVFIDQGL